MVDTVDVRGGAWATTLVKPDVGGGRLQPSAAGLSRWHGEAGEGEGDGAGAGGAKCRGGDLGGSDRAEGGRMVRLEALAAERKAAAVYAPGVMAWAISEWWHRWLSRWWRCCTAEVVVGTAGSCDPRSTPPPGRWRVGHVKPPTGAAGGTWCGTLAGVVVEIGGWRRKMEIQVSKAVAVTVFGLSLSIGDRGVALRAGGGDVRRSTATTCTCAGRSLAAAAAICPPAANLHPVRAQSRQPRGIVICKSQQLL